MNLPKKISYLGHRWYNMGQCDLGSNYIRLERISFMADLKKYGQIPTSIDVKISDLKLK